MSLPPRPSSREETRKKSYKTVLVVDAEEARRKREDNLVEIRKNIRRDNLLKKRTDHQPLPLFPQSPTFNNPNNYTNALELNHLMVQKLWSGEPAAQLEAAKHFCKLLETESGTLIDVVIKAGAVPRFVDFLGRYEAPQLQIAASWALANIASGKSEHTELVIKLGAIPLFVQLLRHCRSEDVRAQAIWGLANIAGDSPNCRNLVLNHGALLPLLAQLSLLSKLSMLRVATWAICNLCRGKPPPHFPQVKPALPMLRELIQLNDDHVIAHACLALSFISDGQIENIQAVIESGVFPRLVQLLHHPKSAVVMHALRTVGNLVTGDDTQTQFVIDNGGLPCLHQLITDNRNKFIWTEACWAISNITAGNRDQIQAVLEANIIPPLINLLQNAEFETKMEAAWAILNATNAGSPNQIRNMVNNGRCIKSLCDMLGSSDPMAVAVCLNGLDNILAVGEADKQMRLNRGINIYVQMVDICAGFHKIRNLLAHQNRAIRQRAIEMIRIYWANDELVAQHQHQHQHKHNNNNNNINPLQSTNTTRQQQDFTFDVPMPPSTPPPNFPPPGWLQ